MQNILPRLNQYNSFSFKAQGLLYPSQARAPFRTFYRHSVNTVIDPPSNPPVCAIVPDAGPCDNPTFHKRLEEVLSNLNLVMTHVSSFTFPKYFYNAAIKKCEMFDYGGCGGNGNKFNSLNECMDVCGNAHISYDDGVKFYKWHYHGAQPKK